MENRMNAVEAKTQQKPYEAPKLVALDIGTATTFNDTGTVTDSQGFEAS